VVATLEDSDSMKRLLILLSLVAAPIVAAPAYADPANNVADFLKQITDAGLTYSDGPKAVPVAKDVCQLLDQGTSGPDIEKNLQSLNPSFSGTGAAKFIYLSSGEYCPKYLTGDSGPSNGASSTPSAPKPPGT
jgi:hypothetical protein